MSGFDFELDDIDPDRMEGGFSSPAPGRYHGEVVAVFDPEPKSGKLAFDVEVLAGTTQNQEGKVQRIFFQSPNGQNKDGDDFSPEAKAVMKKKMLAFAIAAGLTNTDEIKAAKEGKKRLTLDWNGCLQQQICFEVEVNENTKSKTSAKDFCCWPVDSPKAAGIPLNEGKLAMAGDAAADPFDGVF